MNRRRVLLWGAGAAIAAAGGLVWHRVTRFPPDTTPEGAYLRIAFNISEGNPRACFSYLEDRAQHALGLGRAPRSRAELITRTPRRLP